MRQDNFSEISGTSGNPFTGQLYPGNIIPLSALSANRAEAAQLLPDAQPDGHRLELADSDSQHRKCRPDHRSRRSERREQVRLSVRYNWHDSANNNPWAMAPTQVSTNPPSTRNTVVSYTHTLSPNLLNDFRIGYHRVGFDTLKSGFIGSRPGVRRRGSRHSRLQRRRQIHNPGIPTIDLTTRSAASAAAARTGYQFDTTFQLSNVRGVQPRLAQCARRFDLRRLETGRRAANDPRGRFNFTGDMTGHPVADFVLGLPQPFIPPTDQIPG